MPLAEIGYYHFATGKIAGAQCFISRTGYTGEDGFELYCRDRDTVALWDAITAAGAQPIGLGARDSLRLEMGYALYGNDIDDTITPLEAGLGWIVKLDKGAPFIGDDGAPRAEAARRHPQAGRLQARGPRLPAPRLPGALRRPRGGRRPERHHEPVARRRHRHDLPAGGGRPRPGRGSRSSAAASGCRRRW